MKVASLLGSRKALSKREASRNSIALWKSRFEALEFCAHGQVAGFDGSFHVTLIFIAVIDER